MWDFVLQCSQLTSLKISLETVYDEDNEEVHELIFPNETMPREASLQKLQLLIRDFTFSEEAFLDWIGNELEVLDLCDGGIGRYCHVSGMLTRLLDRLKGTLKSLEIDFLSFDGYEDEESEELYNLFSSTRIELPKLEYLGLGYIRDIYPLFHDLDCPNLRKLRLAGSFECHESLKCLVNLADSCSQSLVQLDFWNDRWVVPIEYKSTILVFSRLNTLHLRLEGRRAARQSAHERVEWFSNHRFPELVNLDLEGELRENFISKNKSPKLK